MTDKPEGWTYKDQSVLTPEEAAKLRKRATKVKHIHLSTSTTIRSTLKPR